MYKIISFILSYICSKIPTTNYISFSSFPDYSDNAFAMFKYLASVRADKQYKFYWFFIDKCKIPKYILEINGISDNTSIIYKYSLKGIWIYIRSRYVFETHGMFPILKLHQHHDKHVCLWHGMPLKLLGGSIGTPSSPNMNYTVASSNAYQKIMAEAFSTTIDHVLITGQPRCDLLFENTDWFEKEGVCKSNYKKIGMWMPTYRKSIVGDIRMDGCYVDGGISFLTAGEINELNLFLKENDILLLIKIHPMDALIEYNFDNFSNIVIIKPANFTSQLYPLLGSCDFLLTDYSSVFIDYQITTKPIAFVMNDIDSYKNSRGFYFDNLENILPGPILTTLSELYDFLTHMPNNCKVGNILNEYYDNMASYRIASKLKLQ